MESHIYNEIINVLKPLVEIADAYDRNTLDEDWLQGNQTFIVDVDGTVLLTIQDCFQAREVSNNLKKLMGAS